VASPDAFFEEVIVEHTLERIAKKAKVVFDPALFELQRRGRKLPRPIDTPAVTQESKLDW